jgi:hypothetical protein
MSDRTEWLKELSTRLSVHNYESPSEEWFTAYDLAKAIGKSEKTARILLKGNISIENKKFLMNRNWTNYYREIPKCQEKPLKLSKESLAKSKPSVCRMAVKLK